MCVESDEEHRVLPYSCCRLFLLRCATENFFGVAWLFRALTSKTLRIHWKLKKGMASGSEIKGTYHQARWPEFETPETHMVKGQNCKLVFGHGSCGTHINTGEKWKQKKENDKKLFVRKTGKDLFAVGMILEIKQTINSILYWWVPNLWTSLWII